MSEDFRQESEEHWRFIEKLLWAVTEEGTKGINFETARVLYVEAMVHGFKHGKEGT